MPRFRYRHALTAVLLLIALLAQGTWALAGTTGGIGGTLTDSTSGKPVANATVTAQSLSQTAKATTDGSGHFTFLALTPDTYTLSAEKEGYTPVSVTGVTVFADQSQTVAIQTRPALKTIANVTSRAVGSLVKSGTTADIYSVNATTQQVVAGSGGGFNLNSAYSAVYAQPGVTSSIGNYGWGQVFYIRGSAYSQIGYEFDGVPVNRAFDNYQANSLASLGQQELQVYTGGSPSGSSSATLGGFINQVIKTGTYPGFGLLKGGLGSPGFYHGLTAEAGGANPARTFSYYVGLMGFNQHFPYGNFQNQNNIDPSGQSSYGLVADNESATLGGALTCGINAGCPDGGNFANQFLNGPFPACNNATGTPIGYSAATPGVFNGACRGYGPFGNGYLGDEFERDNVVNLHFAIPHKKDGGRDDLQLLFDNSSQYQINDSSINDNGGLALINGQVLPFATANCGSVKVPVNCGTFTGAGAYTGPYAGLCGYENFDNVGCAATNSPLPYIDSNIFASGTQFGQSASTAVVTPYYFPNSPTNRPLNTAFSPVAGLPTTLRDGFWNDVGIFKAQYTHNFGSTAYARLLGYTFYSDWLISGPTCAATGYFDGLLNGGLCGN
ncbi:MAG TPA: carboxypeptidase regulatory-like domain-containing protein, partial [Candidatus Baltobacteraceae bacterium]